MLVAPRSALAGQGKTAAAMAGRTVSGRLAEGRPIEAAVCALARAECKDSTRAPAMRITARSTAEASTITSHNSWAERLRR